MSDPYQVEKARQTVGYCPDVGGLIPAATPREHIAATLAFRGLTHLWPQAYDLLEQFELARALDKLTGGFSHGMARRLSVVLATLTAEQVLILDEPFDGVDPGGVDVTLEVIETARAAGLAVIISSHMLDLIIRSCDSVSVMTTGKLVATGPAEQFGGPLGATATSSCCGWSRESVAVRSHPGGLCCRDRWDGHAHASPVADGARGPAQGQRRGRGGPDVPAPVRVRELERPDPKHR